MFNARDALLALTLKYEGKWEEIYRAIKEKERPDIDLVAEYHKKSKTDFVTLVDKNYPSVFKTMSKPPFLLFYRGDWNLLADGSKIISYIGSRDASSYGLRMTKTIVGGLVDAKVTICTGLARGIDAEAAKVTLDRGGKLVCVLGNGIEYCYPSSNEDLYERAVRLGLVVSEYPLYTKPSKENFPARNRIVAAVSNGIVVGEAGKRSGTLITVSYGLNLNKEIGCVPYSADARSSCNALIKEGAYMIENAEDALMMIGMEKRKPLSENISEIL